MVKNMKKVFGRVGWVVSAQDKGHYLFNTLNGESHKKFALRPDLVVTRDDGSVVILDTKWKTSLMIRVLTMEYHKRICIRCMHIPRNMTLRRLGFCIQ